jgi:sugar-specific transcriptional regulator TrmB
MVAVKVNLTKNVRIINIMTSLYKTGLSKQAIKIYQLLLSQGNLSTADIARHLDIAPTAVYRLVDHLISLGMITANVGRPTLYAAEDPSTARDRYVSRQQEWFTDSVLGGSTTLSSTNSAKQLAPTSFITGRILYFLS